MLYSNKFLANLSTETQEGWISYINDKKTPQTYSIHKEHLVENRPLVLWLGWQDWNYLYKGTCEQFSALKPWTPSVWPSYHQESSIG